MITVSESDQKGVIAASWTKKGYKPYDGCKQDLMIESQEGGVLAVSTTKAYSHDRTHLPGLLDKVNMQPGSWLYADKGYSGLPNATLFKKYNIKSAIQKNPNQHKPLIDRAKRFNKWVAREALQSRTGVWVV